MPQRKPQPSDGMWIAVEQETGRWRTTWPDAGKKSRPKAYLLVEPRAWAYGRVHSQRYKTGGIKLLLGLRQDRLPQRLPPVAERAKTGEGKGEDWAGGMGWTAEKCAIRSGTGGGNEEGGGEWAKEGVAMMRRSSRAE